MSFYKDVSAIIDGIRKHGGNAELVSVLDEYADSDPGKGKNGHRYLKYSLLNDTSNAVLYSRIRLDDDTGAQHAASAGAHSGSLQSPCARPERQIAITGPKVCHPWRALWSDRTKSYDFRSTETGRVQWEHPPLIDER